MSTTTKETRHDRARREYHNYQFTAAELKVRPLTGPERLVAVVHVASKQNIYTVNLCSDERGDLHTCGCNCEDAQRRKSYEAYPAPCKHMIAAGLWLTGEVPPLPGFDIEGEGELLAKLEQSERIERARREAEVLWD